MPKPKTTFRHQTKAAPRVKFSEEIAEKMYLAIRTDGVSDSRAGLLAGTTPQAVSQWKKREPLFVANLERARSEFQRARLAKVREHADREGAIDWRAQVWLAEQAGLAENEDEPEEDDEADGEPPAFVITPEQLRHLQQRRQAALAKLHP